MRAFEAHHVGNQAVRLLQGRVGGCVHRGFAVPAEGFQRFLHKTVCICIVQTAIALGLCNQLQQAWREDIAARQNLLCLCPQCGVLNQLQT